MVISYKKYLAEVEDWDELEVVNANYKDYRQVASMLASEHRASKRNVV